MLAESFGTGICCDAGSIAKILRRLGFGPGPCKAALRVLVGDDGPWVPKIPEGKCDASLQVITWSWGIHVEEPKFGAGTLLIGDPVLMCQH